MKRKTDSITREAAFTFTDLLAVLVALFLICSLVLPALAGTKGQSKIAQCADNLRQLDIGLHHYGDENNDQLPQSTQGFWLWDTATPVVDTLQQYGIKRENFYCPGAAAQNNDGLWNYSGAFRVLGYGLTLPGHPALISSNANPTLTPQPQTVGLVTVSPFPASQRVLVADATITLAGQNNTNTSSKITYTWNSISGGSPTIHHSPHLLGKLPLGGNVGMMDGHVEWRDFAPMIPRTTASGSTVFWW